MCVYTMIRYALHSHFICIQSVYLMNDHPPKLQSDSCNIVITYIISLHLYGFMQNTGSIYVQLYRIHVPFFTL